MKTKSVTIAGILAAVVLMVSGCDHNVVPWNIVIEKTTPASIAVDLIGATDNDVPVWESTDIDKYLSPGSELRQDTDKITVDLKMGKQQLVLSNTDQKWAEWFNRGVDHLVIIADLPGQWPPGPADRRRMIISLDKGAWKAKEHTLNFQILDTEIRILTRPGKVPNS